ncbi:hypothetical protein B0H34DRAFT_802318 [Crassisporium funariophilum]|nr:hypothetical protein B0H34DRAFT_802318 [Crassisporium funariophilum]
MLFSRRCTRNALEVPYIPKYLYRPRPNMHQNIARLFTAVVMVCSLAAVHASPITETPAAASLPGIPGTGEITSGVIPLVGGLLDGIPVVGGLIDGLPIAGGLLGGGGGGGGGLLGF